MKTLKSNWILSLILVIAIFYILLIHFNLHQSHKKLETEKLRVYQIAEQLEFWKRAAVEYKGQYTIAMLEQDSRLKRLEKITRTEGLSNNPDKHTYYTATFKRIDGEEKQQYKKYFSELVLKRYFYIVTDKNGVITNVEWDKP